MVINLQNKNNKILEIKNFEVFYGKAQVLKGIDLYVGSKEFAAIIGPNGAGKSTLLDAISGLVNIKNGDILFKERSITKDFPWKIVKMGIIHCTEARNLFWGLSAYDNLMLGAYHRNDRKVVQDLDFVLRLFPILKERKKQIASTLSGGEQQMLAIGRAIMGGPELLLLDEPTLGLSPLVIRNISNALRTIHNSGICILLAEQNAVFSIECCERLYLLELGKVVKEGRPSEFKQDEYIKRSYIGY